MRYRFDFTPEIVRSLQAIERAGAEVGLTVLPPGLAEHLRLRARLRSTHFSTRIELSAEYRHFIGGLSAAQDS